MGKYTIQLNWVDVSTASQLLEIKKHIFYTQIKYSKNFPNRSPFKRGIAWRQVSAKKLQINLDNWLTSLNKL